MQLSLWQLDISAALRCEDEGLRQEPQGDMGTRRGMQAGRSTHFTFPCLPLSEHCCLLTLP